MIRDPYTFMNCYTHDLNESTRVLMPRWRRQSFMVMKLQCYSRLLLTTHMYTVHYTVSHVMQRIVKRVGNDQLQLLS